MVLAYPRCDDSPVDADLPDLRGPRQHLLDFDRDPVAVDQDHAASDGQVVGEDLDLVHLGRVQLDDGAAAEAHYLMNRHRSSAEYDHEVDVDFINRCHWNPNRQKRNCLVPDHHVMVSQWLMTAKASI